MTLHRNLRTIAAAAAAGLAMTLAGTALAQPGPGPHPGRGGGHGEMLGGVIAHAKAQLNLNTSQQQMFDTAAAHSKAAFAQGRTLRQSVSDALKAELAKPEPDFAAVAAVADQAQQQGQALRTSIRTEWLNLYATFSPEQKAVVRDIVQKRVDRADAWHDKMRQKMQDRAPAKS